MDKRKIEKRCVQVSPGFFWGGAPLCQQTLTMVVKGICLPMNSYHQFFIISGITIRKKKNNKTLSRCLPTQVSSSFLFVAVSRPSLPVNHLL